MKKLTFNEKNLIPAIIQDHETGEVLMMAYMNPLSLRRTLRASETYFYSRSRRILWHKGATSGNRQRVKEIRVDCDNDTLLLLVDPKGPACHTGSTSCFFRNLKTGKPIKTKPIKVGPDILDRVYALILERKKKRPKDSYVASLFKSGRDKILKKIGEEAGEVIISGSRNKKSEMIWEIADLWFHTLVMMGYHHINPQDLYEELARRFGRKSKPSKRGKSS